MKKLLQETLHSKENTAKNKQITKLNISHSKESSIAKEELKNNISKINTKYSIEELASRTIKQLTEFFEDTDTKE